MVQNGSSWVPRPMSEQFTLPLSTYSTGGSDTVSTVHVYVAGVGSVLPFESVACTENVCEPSTRPGSETGDVHGANGAESSWHWNVEPGADETNEKLAEGLLDGSGGCAVIVVSGASRLSVQV